MVSKRGGFLANIVSTSLFPTKSDSTSKDETRILTVSDDNSARVWDALNGDELLFIQARSASPIRHAIWNKDESKILTGNYDSTARVWDAQNGQEILRLQGHTDAVSQAIWSADETKIMTASHDHTARVWDAESGEELFRLQGHSDRVEQVLWNRDESRILTGSEDKTVRVWDVNMINLVDRMCDWLPRNLTWDEWSQYMGDAYRPTCPNAAIPSDVIINIKLNAREEIKNGRSESAILRLQELNSWLNNSEQLNNLGVDIESFISSVQAETG